MYRKETAAATSKGRCVKVRSVPASGPLHTWRSTPRSTFPVPLKHKHEIVMFTCLLFLLFCTGEGHQDEGGNAPHSLAHRLTSQSSISPPQFDPSHSPNVTALAGNTAILNCRVHNLHNRTVSWMRHRDIHLLSVGRFIYTTDQRFRAMYDRDTDDWVLKINYVQPRDSGVYECQISTTPPMSHSINLRVVEPHTHILGGPDLYLNTGSTINLTCLVEFSPVPPKHIFWSHNEKIISYDSSRGGVTVILEKGDLTTSTLLIQRATLADSGHYRCGPTNASPANITVHVLNGEHPAPMQKAGQQSTYANSPPSTFLLLLVLLMALQTVLM